MSLLEVNHIDVHYGDFLALKDVSIHVEPGTIVSLIGANGAGKSTIMNTICGLNKPTKGDIIFDGQNIAFLSGGQRQMLAIGRGIMTQPKILLCDEISLGLAPVVINDIYEKLKEIADTGLTMLIVEQDVNRSLKSSDYAYVVLEGKIVMQGKSKELSVDEVNDAYFGINTFSH